MFLERIIGISSLVFCRESKVGQLTV